MTTSRSVDTRKCNHYIIVHNKIKILSIIKSVYTTSQGIEMTVLADTRN